MNINIYVQHWRCMVQPTRLNQTSPPPRPITFLSGLRQIFATICAHNNRRPRPKGTIVRNAFSNNTVRSGIDLSAPWESVNGPKLFLSTELYFRPLNIEILAGTLIIQDVLAIIATMNKSSECRFTPFSLTNYEYEMDSMLKYNEFSASEFPSR